MRIFLINLDRSPERLGFMQAQLADVGLQAERLPAIDGTQIDFASYSKSGLTAGEVGCFLSHRAAWEMLLVSGDSHALIIEDDVRISRRLPGILKDINTVGFQFDVLKLDTSKRVVALEKQARAGAASWQAYRLCGEHTGTAGYVLSKDAAAELLHGSKVFSLPVDIFLFGEAAVAETKLEILQLTPAVVMQDKHFGKIGGTKLGSSIRLSGSAKPAPASRVLREFRRVAKRVRTFAERIPSILNGTRRYCRIKFR